MNAERDERDRKPYVFDAEESAEVGKRSETEMFESVKGGTLGIEGPESEVDGDEGIARLATRDGSIVFDKGTVDARTIAMQDEFVADFAKGGLIADENGKFSSERFGMFFQGDPKLIENDSQVMKDVNAVLVEMRETGVTIDEINFQQLDSDGNLVKEVIDSLRNFAKRDEINSAIDEMLPLIPQIKDEEGQVISNPQAMVSEVDGETQLIVSGGDAPIYGFAPSIDGYEYDSSEADIDISTGRITLVLKDKDGVPPKFRKITFFVKRKFNLLDQMRDYEQNKLDELMAQMEDKNASANMPSYSPRAPRAASTTASWRQPTSYVSSG